MSKLLKSKLFLGVMLVAVMFVGVVAVNATPAAAVDCSITSTLRVGSVGTEVSCLQTHLGVLADGKFGPMTAAAVKAWQASKGLAADGVFGAMSRAAMSTSAGVLPAGCMSTAGYSSTTGVKCDSAVSTGLPAGCMSTSGYSSTTGAKCDGGSTSTGPLTGGAGDLNGADVLSTYSGEEVLEGDEDVKVLAFELEADDGSDLAIKNVKLGFANDEVTAGSSKKMNSVIDEVKVWMGTDEVGSASSDDFSESSDVYTKSIALDGAVVRAGEKEKFYVTVSSVSNVDSDDLGNSWEVAVESVRFEDAEGVVTTDSSTGDLNDVTYKDHAVDAGEKFFSFEDLSTSGDIELKVSRGSASPDAQVVEVDDTNDTNDVVLLEAKLKAEGTDMTVDNIEFDVTPTGADANEIVKEWKLLVDGEEIDSIAAGSIASTFTGQIEFANLEDDFMIGKGDTVTVKVVADINDIEGNFSNGDSILVTFDNTNNVDDTTNTVVDDENGDTVVAGDRSGSASGEAQTFFSEGVDVDMGNVTYTETEDTNGDVTKVTYTIPFTVKAFGTEAYIPTSVAAQSAASASAGSNGLNYEIESSADATIAAANIAGSAGSITSSANVVGGRYEISDGDEESFSVTISMEAPAGSAATLPGFYRVQLLDLGYSLTSAGAVVNLDLTPESDFDTVDRQIDVI